MELSIQFLMLVVIFLNQAQSYSFGGDAERWHEAFPISVVDRERRRVFLGRSMLSQQVLAEDWGKVDFHSSASSDCLRSSDLELGLTDACFGHHVPLL